MVVGIPTAWYKTAEGGLTVGVKLARPNGLLIGAANRGRIYNLKTGDP